MGAFDQAKGPLPWGEARTCVGGRTRDEASTVRRLGRCNLAGVVDGTLHRVGDGDVLASLELGEVALVGKLEDFAVAPAPSAVAGPAVDDVLSALTNLGYQRPAAEKAIEQSVAKEKALAADFDGLFRAALKVIR